MAHEAFALAVALKLNVYDPEVTGVAWEEAARMTVRLIGSLAHRHKVNQAGGGWGDQWQSALWAAQTATAGWLLWEQLSARDQDRCAG
ncbi:MAG: hypothetical protein V8S95_06160 [Odoribacter sp.]